MKKRLSNTKIVLYVHVYLNWYRFIQYNSEYVHTTYIPNLISKINNHMCMVYHYIFVFKLK